jgi:integrase
MSLFKPIIVEYRLPNGAFRTPDGKRVTSKTPGAIRSEREVDKWYGRFTDRSGKRKQVPLSKSKEIARRMLAKLTGDAQLASVGLGDPFALHRQKSLAEHLEEYARHLKMKGDGEKHVRNTLARCRAIFAARHLDAIEDLQPGPVLAFLEEMRERSPRLPSLTKDQYGKTEAAYLLGIHPASLTRCVARDGLAAEGAGKARTYPRSTVEAIRARLPGANGVATRNHYLAAIKGFCHWLAREGRIPVNPIAHLSAQNARVDVRRRRRALQDQAFFRLLEATAAGPPFRGIAGADRLVMYTLAAQTGFRAGELASLTSASFDLAADPPSVTVEAAYSKRRRRDSQPLRKDVAVMLEKYLRGRPRRQRVWPGTWRDRAAEMVRIDLAAAGIPFEDEDGRSFDFHALRGQFITFLAARGVHPKAAQMLARHSTITLTLDHYTHLDRREAARALKRLPAPIAPPTVPAERGARHG